MAFIFQLELKCIIILYDVPSEVEPVITVPKTFQQVS